MMKFISITISILLVSCSFIDTGNRQPIKILNNNGGFSHGGLTIKLMDDGSALVTTYSDAIDDAKSTHGTYELKHDSLMIRYRNGDVMKLQKVIHKGQEYWVKPSSISQLTENSNEGEWQRRTALKTVQQEVAIPKP